jgi:membrane protease YdiL (CAAX protease family)
MPFKHQYHSQNEAKDAPYKPVRFFLIAFLFTWVFWFLAAYCSYQEGMSLCETLLIFPGLFGPSVAALIMLSRSESKELRKDFWDRLRLGKIKPRFIPALLLLVPLIILLATAISLPFGYSTDQFAVSDAYMVLKGHGAVSLIILCLAPTFEELGWRGYGVDSLRQYFNLWNTSVLFGLLWGIWHLPLFFIKGYYHHELWEMNIAYVINFFVSVIAASILMNWLYYKNGRSIIVAIVFHCMLDIFYVVFQTEPFTKCIATVLMALVAATLVVKNKAFFFDKHLEYGQ